jgi:hypothetical protein
MLQLINKGLLKLKGNIMRTIKYSTDNLSKMFHKEKVLTIEEIMEALGAYVKMTMVRKLKTLSYLTSYSHAGKYYTLQEIPGYDENGLWSYNGILFSRNGSLINTTKHLIDISDAGHFASELKEILKIRVQEALLNLYIHKRVLREQISGEYLYLSIEQWESQLRQRKELIEAKEGQKGAYPASGFDSPEVRIGLQVFISTLNEKQKRLYCGFEAMKLGRGGDTLMSRITGINIKTIARGRKELLAHDITPERIRREGAGRHSIKKN